MKKIIIILVITIMFLCFISQKHNNFEPPSFTDVELEQICIEEGIGL